MVELEYDKENPRWYIVIVRSNYEFKFKRDFVEGLINNELIDFVYDIFVPIKKFTIEWINSQQQIRNKIISEKVVSLYVFVKAQMTNELLNYIKILPSASSVLTIGSALATITDEEAKNYRQQCIVQTTTYKGHKIVKSEDPYENAILTIKKKPNHSNKSLSILDIILYNEKRLQYQLDLDTKYRQQMIKDNIIDNIYKTEEFIQSKMWAKKIPLFIKDRINFKALDINSLSKLLNKFSLSKKFLNLDSTTINYINTHDLEYLKNLLAKHQIDSTKTVNKKSFNKKSFNKGQRNKHSFYKSKKGDKK